MHILYPCCRKMTELRYHKGIGTKMHRCESSGAIALMYLRWTRLCHSPLPPPKKRRGKTVQKVTLDCSCSLVRGSSSSSSTTAGSACRKNLIFNNLDKIKKNIYILASELLQKDTKSKFIVFFKTNF